MAPPVVLCVEDDAAVLQLHTIVLERAGYDVVAAANGAEALDIFRSRPIDIVVSDHVHTGGADIVLFRDMKRFDPSVPILLVSGLIEPPEEAEYADEFIPKMQGSKVLLARISAHLRHRKAS